MPFSSKPETKKSRATKEAECSRAVSLCHFWAWHVEQGEIDKAIFLGSMLRNSTELAQTYPKRFYFSIMQYEFMAWLQAKTKLDPSFSSTQKHVIFPWLPILSPSFIFYFKYALALIYHVSPVDFWRFEKGYKYHYPYFTDENTEI